METIKAFCKRKNIEVSAKRYGIDALGAMAQGLFCSLLIGTIIKTLGAQLHVQLLIDVGSYAMAVASRTKYRKLVLDIRCLFGYISTARRSAAQYIVVAMQQSMQYLVSTQDIRHPASR